MAAGWGRFAERLGGRLPTYEPSPVERRGLVIFLKPVSVFL